MGRSSARALVAGHFKLSRSVRIDDSTLFLDKRKDLREKGDDVEEEEKKISQPHRNQHFNFQSETHEYIWNIERQGEYLYTWMKQPNTK